MAFKCVAFSLLRQVYHRFISLQIYPMHILVNLLSSNFNEQRVAKILFDSICICNKLLQVP